MMGMSCRKARLLACAVARSVPHSLETYPLRCIAASEGFADGMHTKTVMGEAERKYAGGQTGVLARDRAALACCHSLATAAVTAAMREHSMLYPDQHQARCVQAAILRDIIINPFTGPVTLPAGPPVKCEQCDGKKRFFTTAASSDTGLSHWDDCPACKATGTVPGPCPWLTAEVLGLATAAYECRVSRKCVRCRNGKIGGPSHSPDELQDCEYCHGTGQYSDGTLDPARLAVLSDALEESGCTDTAILQHLRGKEWADMHSFLPSRWVDLPVRCVRGCHVLDAILGKG